MPVPHCMFSAGRCVFWCPLAGAESDFCGRNGRWKGLIFLHNRVFVQNQGAVLKKSSLRGVHPGDFPSRQGENERGLISCAHSSWIKRSTLLCRKMTRVHPVVSFPPFFIFYRTFHLLRSILYFLSSTGYLSSFNLCSILIYFSLSIFNVVSFVAAERITVVLSVVRNVGAGFVHCIVSVS